MIYPEYIRSTALTHTQRKKHLSEWRMNMNMNMGQKEILAILRFQCRPMMAFNEFGPYNYTLRPIICTFHNGLTLVPPLPKVI